MPASEKVIELIRKLQNIKFERGANPNEVELAAVKIQKLLEEHQLTMFDVEQGKFDETVMEETVLISTPGEDDSMTQVPGWAQELAASVSYPNDCRLVFSHRPFMVEGAYTGKYVRVINFIGHESDVKVATYLYAVLSRLLWHMGGRHARRSGITGAQQETYRKDFVIGAARAIHKRLREEKEVSKTSAQTGGKCTALVLVKTEKVKEYVDRTYANLRLMKGAVTRNVGALIEGYQEGLKVPLRKGLQGQTQQYLPGG